MPSTIVSGAQIYYTDVPGPRASGPRKSSGDPVALFLHGAGGDHTVWGHQIAALRGRFGAVAVDLPGHGRSSRVEDLSVPAQARRICELMRRLGIDSPVLVGHSMGGAIALQIALDHPSALRGLALVGSGAKMGVEPRVFHLIEQDARTAVRQITSAAYADGTPEEIVRAGEAALSRCTPEVLLADFRACEDFDVRERVSGLKVPLLVICGDADRLSPPRFSEWLATSVPGARLVLVPGAGHLAMIERPEDVSATLIDFLEGLPSASRSQGAV